MSIKKISKAFGEWQRTLSMSEGDSSTRRRTTADIELETVYIPTEADFDEKAHLERLGFPGAYPYTRGVHRSMYRGKLWTMRQYAGFGDAIETNARYRYLLANGTTGLSVAFDLPTQMGRDSDHELARGEVGRVGVAICDLEDMENLFAGIPLDQVSTSMTINATAHILLALYLAVAKKQNVPWQKLRGTVQNDVLKEYIARGTYIYPPKRALKIVTDIFAFCRDHVPQWNAISVSGYHIREAGSTAVQEVAFTLANAIAYLRAAQETGLTVDDVAQRMAFFFNCHNNFLEEIAKFRAARRLWASLMRNEFKAKDERSLMLRFHTQTAGSSLTAQQPEINVVRTTIQALAAVLGGTQSLHTNGFDEALSLPSEESARVALRTQQIIAHESGVADIADALGGSYAIERLTDEIETRAREYLKKIDSLGGMVAAIGQSFPQQEIEEAAFRYQQQVEKNKCIVVGVNKFVEKNNSKESLKASRINPELERRQQERLAAYKAKRSAQAVNHALRSLQEAIKEDRNVMPAICESVECGATLGEISDIFRQIYGEYHGT